MFAYGLGYRMCTGSMLANREFYLVFIRMLNAFRIENFDDVGCHPCDWELGSDELGVDTREVYGEVRVEGLGGAGEDDEGV